MITLLAAGTLAWAGTPRQVTWAELSFVKGQTVQVAMPDGTVVSGRVTDVETDALVVRKGNTDVRVPRASLKVLDIQRKSHHWRVVGTVVGAVAGVAGGFGAALAIDGLLSRKGREAQALTAFVAITAGGTLAGYLVGNAADRHSTTVVIKE